VKKQKKKQLTLPGNEGVEIIIVILGEGGKIKRVH
jgi:hypothetical protein